MGTEGWGEGRWDVGNARVGMAAALARRSRRRATRKWGLGGMWGRARARALAGRGAGADAAPSIIPSKQSLRVLQAIYIRSFGGPRAASNGHINKPSSLRRGVLNGRSRCRTPAAMSAVSQQAAATIGLATSRADPPPRPQRNVAQPARVCCACLPRRGPPP